MTGRGITKQPSAEQREELRLNRQIAWVLIAGLLGAMGLLAVGVVLSLVQTGTKVPHASSISGIPSQLAALEPAGFYQAGLLVLLATPFVRVVALLVAFAARRHWLFAGISVLVAAMLIAGAVLGLSLG